MSICFAQLIAPSHPHFPGKLQYKKDLPLEKRQALKIGLARFKSEIAAGKAPVRAFFIFDIDTACGKPKRLGQNIRNLAG